MYTRILTILVLIAVTIVSALVFFYTNNVAKGEVQFTNKGSSIALSPIYAPGDIVKKSFEKEFGQMARSIDSDDD